MANLNGFDANKHEPNKAFDPLPAGKYLAMITESDNKPTAKGGGMIVLVFTVCEGEHKGRKLWVRLNLQNANPQAVAIAQGDLSAICRAVGIMTPRDTQELHAIPVCLTVKCRKRKDTNEMENVVAGFAAAAAYREQGQAPGGGAPGQSAGGATTPPWKRG